MRTTLAAVNKALADDPETKGVELVRGDGYFYFVGDRVQYAETTSVMVPRLNDLKVWEWCYDAKKLIAESTAKTPVPGMRFMILEIDVEWS